MKIRLKCKRGRAGNTSLLRACFRETGYTFVEVLVAGAILGFVGTSLYAAFSVGFYVIQSTRENLRATQVMVQKLEAIRLFTWSQVCDTNSYLVPSFVEPYDPLSKGQGMGGATYAGYVSSSVPAAGELPEAYRTNMRTITVSLCWTNYNGAKAIPHKREMQTRVTRNGMQNYIWGAL
jgi:type II secretory pathway pseudopilin PulG